MPLAFRRSFASGATYARFTGGPFGLSASRSLSAGVAAFSGLPSGAPSPEIAPGARAERQA
jgi:hypothetical protein